MTLSIDPWPLTNVLVEVTQQCNQQCRYCLLGELQNPLHPETQVLKQWIAQIAELHPLVLVITGGEPLLRTDLLELITTARKEGIENINVCSNGTLMTREIAETFASTNISVTMSLDSFDPEEFNYYRRDPHAFEKAMKAAELLENAGGPFGFNAVITNRNYEHMEKLVEFLVNHHVGYLNAQRMFDRGRAACDQELSLTPQMLKRALEQLHNAEHHYPIRIGWAEPARALVNPEFKVKYKIFIEASDENPPPLVLGCSIGKTLSIMSNGDVRFCCNLDYTDSNISRTPLRAIWETSPLLQAFRDRRTLKGRCGICKYKYICGGCRVSAYLKYKDPFAEDPTCWYRKGVKG